MTGAYFADGDQHLDYDTFQEHIAPNTTSDFAFKGALRDQATTVWRGMIRVEQEAQKTNAYQENRNLLLSPKAPCRLDPRPRDPGQRRALHPRRDARPGRSRAALLPDGARPLARGGRAADRARLLPGRARPDRARAGARGAGRRARGAHPAGYASARPRQRVARTAHTGRTAWGYDLCMAVAAQTKLDARKLRADFPIFEQQSHGKPLAFLDSAASSQKPRQVLEAMNHFYETSYANVHRGVYELAERATEALELAREKTRAFVNAPDVARDHLRPQRDRGDQPRRVRVGAEQPRPRGRRPRHRARAPLELRPLAVHRRQDRRRLPDAPARRPGRAAARPARRDGRRRDGQGRRGRARLQLARDGQPDREAGAVGARARRDRRLRRGAGGTAPDSSTCRRSAPTSSPSRVTSCAGRAGSASSGGAPTCSRRWSRS